MQDQADPNNNSALNLILALEYLKSRAHTLGMHATASLINAAHDEAVDESKTLKHNED